MAMLQDPVNGRFMKGGPGGPGRPARHVEEDYLQAFSAVSLADWKMVIKRALADAKKGDSRARDWLSRYILGDQPLASLVANRTGPMVLNVIRIQTQEEPTADGNGLVEDHQDPPGAGALPVE